MTGVTEGLDSSERPNPAAIEPVTDVLVTLHGIRDNGSWQDSLQEIYEERMEKTRHEKFKYGFFDILKFIFPLSRRNQVAQFKSRLTKLLTAISKRTKGSYRVHFAAHSFGTHVLTHALPGLPDECRQNIANIVIMGSVLPSSFDIMSLTTLGANTKIYNFCSTNDNVLLVNAALPLRSGLAGRVGFKGLFEGSLIEQRFFRFGHGGYFADMHLGSSSWLAKYCVPALMSAPLPTGTHQRPRYGDFLSDLLRFSKIVLIAVLFSAATALYAILTVDGVLRTLEYNASILDNKDNLTILDLPEVNRLTPSAIYKVFSEVQHFENFRIGRLYERIYDENKVTFALPRKGVRDATMRESDNALLVSLENEVAIFANVAKPGEALRYSRRSIWKGPVAAIGFTNNGNPYIVDNNELSIQACLSCYEEWRAFPLKDSKAIYWGRVHGYPNFGFVHELPDGRILLFASEDTDEGIGLYFLESQKPPVAVRVPSSGSGQPNPEHGLPFKLGNHISVAPLIDRFKGFVVIADHNSVLIAGSSGESIFVSQDPSDFTKPGVDFETRLDLTTRRLEIEQGKTDDNYKSGHFCNAGGCSAYPIAFAATEPAGADQLVLDPYSKGDELFVEVYTIQPNIYPFGSGRSSSYCLRIARMAEINIRPVTSPEEQRVDCEINSDSGAYTHSKDGKEIDVNDPFFLETDDWIAIKSNPIAYNKYAQRNFNKLGKIDISMCAKAIEGERRNDSFIYTDGRSFAIRCDNSMTFVNDWGVEKTIKIDRDNNSQIPLFFRNSAHVVAAQVGRSMVLFDKATPYESPSFSVGAHNGPSGGKPWVPFVAGDRSSFTWVEGSELVAFTYEIHVSRGLRRKVTRLPLEVTPPDFGHFNLCNHGIWYKGRDNEIQEMRSDWYDPGKSITLLSGNSPVCDILGAPLFVFNSNDRAFNIGDYVLTSDINPRGEPSFLSIARIAKGDIRQALEASYSRAIRLD